MDLARRDTEPAPAAGASADTAAVPAAPAQAAAGTPDAAPLWLRRLSLAVYILFCLEMGLLLVVLPWHPVWLNNSLIAGHPYLTALAHNHFVRGAVSGLGLVDIWLALAEALRHRESRSAPSSL